MMRRRGLLHSGLTCANQRNFLNSVFFCDLHKMSPKRSMFLAFSYLSVLSRTWGECLDMHILCNRRQDRLKQRMNHFSIHLTDQNSRRCRHVFTVCCYFTALSIDSSSTTVELTDCSFLRPCSSFWWFEPKTFLFVLFVVSAILKGGYAPVPYHFHMYSMCVCLHCLNATFISFPCLSQRKPKHTFFTTFKARQTKLVCFYFL